MRLRLKKKVIYISFVLLFLLSGLFIFFHFIMADKSLARLSYDADLWDGSVATSFSGGNGTEENPYQISSGSEFAYLSSVLNSMDRDTYVDSYFELTKDLNMDNIFFESVPNSSIKFNGNGNTIGNLKLNNALFSSTSNGYIKNINLENIELKNSEENNYGILVYSADYYDLENISIINANVDISGNAAGLAVFLNLVKLSNIYINASLPNDGYSVSYSNDENRGINKVITRVNYQDSYISNFFNTSVSSSELYYYNGASYINNNTNVSFSNLINQMNTNNNGEIKWLNYKGHLVFESKNKIMTKYEAISNSTTSYNTFNTHASGTSGTIIYVNDLESDYNYFMGLNYTENNNNVYPDGINSNIYNKNNLVRVQIAYNGKFTIDDKDYTSNLSISEKYDTYIYYKYYKVDKTSENHGYVTIELIDNPFTDMPNDYAFNGWYTTMDNAEIIYDKDYYTRYVKVPVNFHQIEDFSYAPDDITINIYPSLVPAKIETISRDEFQDKINKLDSAGMHELKKSFDSEVVVRDAFVKSSIGLFSNYNGYYNENAVLYTSGRCGTLGGCTVYSKIISETYDSTKTYYKYVGGSMKTVDKDTLEYDTSYYDLFTNKTPMAGYFEKVQLWDGSFSGYYDESGKACSSSNCSYGNYYYYMIPYKDGYGNINYYDSTKTYYYLATRDTNILFINSSISSTWGNNQSKPLTVTSAYNDENLTGSVTWTISNTYLKANADLKIQNIKISSGSGTSSSDMGSGTTTSKYLYGNYYNVKLGRGIIKSGNYQTFSGVNGGSNSSSGSSSNITKYKLIVESGFYNVIGVVAGAIGETNIYVNAKSVFGNDFDRIKKDNSKLNVYFTTSGSWGGNIRATKSTDTAIEMLVKSGSFGTGKSDYSTGIYVGGRTGGMHYATRKIIYEGGYTYNLIGGPITDSSIKNINDIYMYIKGGEIDSVTGGAGRSTTYGNKVISITDGTINYNVFGGSNGVSGSDSEGKLDGSTFIYLGGSSKVGTETLVSNESKLWGASAGSVFGAGNGNSSYSTIGSVNNSYIIIDDNANILGNVYGGGNYGNINNETGKTNIELLGGTLENDIFGSSNQSGTGSNSNKAKVNINLNGSTINGNIYGGSNLSGVVYGDVAIDLINGTVKNDIYGGGKGSSTAINGNVSINVGSNNTKNLNITRNIYGGSAYGIVNNNESINTVTSYTTKIETKSGIVHGSIFGGGKGDEDNTPVVAGNITVDIDGGNIGSVYGGSDASGVPNGTTPVTIKSGIVGNVFGGGNNVKVKTPYVTINGGTISYVYGGSNNGGDNDKTEVFVNSSVTNLFGGNNLGGSVKETNITIIEGRITNVYGGGNKVDALTTNILVNGGFITNLYGSGNEAGSTTTNVLVSDGVVDYLYGGSNQSGNVGTTNVTVDKEEKESPIEMTVSYDKYDADWRSQNYKYGLTVKVTIKNNYTKPLTEFDASIQIRDSVLYSNYTGTTLNVVGDTYSFNHIDKNSGPRTIDPGEYFSFTFEVLSNYDETDDIVQTSISGKSGSTVLYNSDNDVINLFGGNNEGGTTNETHVLVAKGNVYNIYGGGNYATSTNNNVKTEGGSTRIIYGGGKEAKTSGNINLDVGVSSIEEYIYGGGDNADVEGTINVKVHGANVGKSIYGGSNTADVNGNININISDNTIVERSVFGGGNHGKVGKVSTPSSTLINIVGALIKGNVYGGCNTSVVYGSTTVNVGTNASTVSNLVESDIEIKGTIFGGGETNENGDEVYSFDFKSVIGTIDINIDATNYKTNNHDFVLLGSIFGSGNASSSKGTSKIYIKNLGTKEKISELVSIQRSDEVTLDHSVVEIKGITDSTNMFSNIPYSFNRINKLVLKDNTTIYSNNNTNLLKSFYSVTRDDEKAQVYINEDGSYVRNVDNRLYTQMNKNFYVTTDENATAYGVVSGMTFFGMFTKTNGKFNFGVYDESIQAGSPNDESILGGAYVMGLHNTNHDIKVDGFYTNYNGEENVTVDFITPKPPTGTMYMWSIGTKTITYDVYLTATKYSSLGTTVLPMVDFAEGDTTLNVIDFTTENMNQDLWLMDGAEVPKTTTNDWEAKTKIGVSMKSESTEWTNHGTTKFIEYNSMHSMPGTKTYITDSQATVPSLMFYLYHAKNISEDQDLGYITINLQALTPKNDIEYEVTNVTINVHMDVNTADLGDSYDAAITYGDKYELPSTTTVNITNRSQFTTYYSLLITEKTKEEIYGNTNGYYHALVSDYVLPVGTKITMLDYGATSSVTPNYYYYIVDENSYQNSLEELNHDGEVSYRLSDFVQMGSTTTTNKYNDAYYNDVYYKGGMTYEEFMFIFNFDDTTSNSTDKNNSILFELKNEEGRSKVTVLGQRQELMTYNLYNTSNIALEENVELKDKYIFNNSDISFNYSTNVNYDKTDNFESVIDTNYEASNMGLNILLLDTSNNQISSSLLEDTTISINNNLYHAYADGIFRIKLANKVSNISRIIQAHIGNSLPVGHYKVVFTLFASADGLFNDGTRETIKIIEIDVLESGNVIVVTNEDEYSYNGDDSITLSYNIDYYNELSNPNIRLSTYLRDKTSSTSKDYKEINIETISNIKLESIDNKNTKYEKGIEYNETGNIKLNIPLLENISSGTYKFEFKLCNDDYIVDTFNTYIIIKKELNN